jgi:hypothetical protein
VCLADQVNIGEIKKSIIDALGDDEGRHPSIGTSIMKEGNLLTMQCVSRER